MTEIFNYDHRAAMAYCEQIGLHWYANLVINADMDAKKFNFTQEQFDVAMRHHLWQVRHLFDPGSYSFCQRIVISLWFLFGHFRKLS